MAKLQHRKPTASGSKKGKKTSQMSTKAQIWLLIFLVLLFIGIILYLYSVSPRRSASESDSPREMVSKTDKKSKKDKTSAKDKKTKTPGRKSSTDAQIETGKKKPTTTESQKTNNQSNLGNESKPKSEEAAMKAWGDIDDLYKIHYEQDALPELQTTATSQVITHKAYTLSYNADYKVPNWVFYELVRGELKGDTERSDKFKPDPEVRKSQSASLADYNKSGYDRGHIAPAADFSWDDLAMNESFYLSNMCPQKPDFNRGIWKSLEELTRHWAQLDSAICVVSGPVLPKSADVAKYATIGNNKVIVPQYFYKVIFAPFGDHPKAIAFILPNEGSKKSLKSFAVTVDSVEALTGIDFFSVVDDKIEDAVEGSYTISDWVWK